MTELMEETNKAMAIAVEQVKALGITPETPQKFQAALNGVFQPMVQLILVVWLHLIRSWKFALLLCGVSPITLLSSYRLFAYKYPNSTLSLTP